MKLEGAVNRPPLDHALPSHTQLGKGPMTLPICLTQAHDVSDDVVAVLTLQHKIGIVSCLRVSWFLRSAQTGAKTKRATNVVRMACMVAFRLWLRDRLWAIVMPHL